MNNVQEQETLKAMQETLSLQEFPVIDEDILTQEVYLMCLYGNGDIEKRYTLKFPHLLFKRWHPYITNVL